MEEPAAPPAPPKWLQDLEENSWNLELFISGGAIFSLVQANDWLLEAVSTFRITTSLTGTNFLLIIIVIALQLLTLGFGLHLLLRAAWVALVCVSYLYPGGVQTGLVRWRRPFRARVPSGAGLHDAILRLDRICAGVMFVALIATALLGGFVLLLSVLLVVPSITAFADTALWDYYTAGILLLLLVYVLDLVLFGLLRRLPVVALVVFPVFWLYDRLSLRILFQPALWLFATNVPRWRIGGLLLLFVLLALFTSFEVLQRGFHWLNPMDRRAFRDQLAPNHALHYGFYRDELGEQPQGGVTIQSKLVDKPFVDLFVVYRAWDDAALRNLKARYVADLLQLSVDDSVYAAISWYPTQKRSSSQLGVTAMVPIAHLPNGPHHLRIASRADTSYYAVIPFWKATD